MKVTMPQQLLGGADGIRAIACITVIMHHFAQRLAPNNQDEAIRDVQAFFMAGNTGVSTFFVLSGFLLAFPFWKSFLEKDPFPSINQYMVRRAVRIMPAYYVVFIVSIVIVLVLNIPSEHFLLRSLAGLTFTSGFHYTTFFPSEINGPLWSISFEVFCYAVMPVIMLGMFKWLKSRSFKTALAYWLGALVVVLFINQLIHLFLTPGEENRGWQFGNIGGAKFWMPNYNPVGFFAHFTIGIFAAAVAAKLRHPSPKVEKLKRLGVFDIIAGISLINGILLLWFLRYVPEFMGSLQQQPFFYPFFALHMAIPLAIGSHTLVIQKILDNRFFKYTAKVSFGLYLWHYLFITLVAMYIANDYHYMGVASLERWGLISLAILLASYLVATLSYFFVEKPVLDWAHNRHKKKKASTTQADSINLS